MSEKFDEWMEGMAKKDESVGTVRNAMLLAFQAGQRAGMERAAEIVLNCIEATKTKNKTGLGLDLAVLAKCTVYDAIRKEISNG
jgi:hypothetical protein